MTAFAAALAEGPEAVVVHTDEVADFGALRDAIKAKCAVEKC
jgi:hypothetical protein